MKPDIHPKYQQTTISCACGNLVQTRGTVERMHVDICAKCHPFYTGKRQLLVDRGGRIEQFNRRYNRRAGQEPEAAVAEGATQS